MNLILLLNSNSILYERRKRTWVKLFKTFLREKLIKRN